MIKPSLNFNYKECEGQKRLGVCVHKNDSESDIQEAFGNLPSSLEWLYLEVSCNSKSWEPDRFKTVFSCLPKNVTILDFSNYGFSYGIGDCFLDDRRDPRDVTKIFSYIPSHVKQLVLFNNDFRQPGNGQHYAEVFSGIPSTIETVDLTQNDFCCLTEIDLLLMFKSLPQTIKKLNLSDNSLLKRDPEFMRYLFALLPSELEILTIMDPVHEEQERYKSVDLVYMFKHIPKKVKRIELCKRSIRGDASLIQRVLFKTHPDICIFLEPKYSGYRSYLGYIKQQLNYVFDLVSINYLKKGVG